ncbi:DUF805 domain-containing protein [Ramlibacter sp. G-1-2-2]|uniref:DUF805 domain-containing protein n=1 Tax=Ramlibacter agri TaxID=2728837 RepID=A0A848HDC6_9BURK|nr:DUF805 domain-containing protein [Ramlibacter agri]NML48464.1 DUF805 domain-containing protein [Ramlibacter agri]
MTFIDAVKACFGKYATFSGRAGKAEFWWFALFQFIVLLVLGMFSNLLYGLASLALLLPALAVGTRRLHDIGKSGWFQLIWLVPFVGWILLIYWLVQPSGPANAYGDGPDAPLPEDVVPGAQ